MTKIFYDFKRDEKPNQVKLNQGKKFKREKPIHVKLREGKATLVREYRVLTLLAAIITSNQIL